MLHRDLSIVARGSAILFSRRLAAIGISAPEFFLLLYLYEKDRPRQEDIVDFFMLDKGTIARTLQKLENKGFIIRTIDQLDQRKKFIQLTDKGYSIKDICINLVHKWHEIVLKDISAQDIEVFERVLRTMAINIATNLGNWES